MKLFWEGIWRSSTEAFSNFILIAICFVFMIIMLTMSTYQNYFVPNETRWQIKSCFLIYMVLSFCYIGTMFSDTIAMLFSGYKISCVARAVYSALLFASSRLFLYQYLLMRLYFTFHHSVFAISLRKTTILCALSTFTLVFSVTWCVYGFVVNRCMTGEIAMLPALIQDLMWCGVLLCMFVFKLMELVQMYSDTVKQKLSVYVVNSKSNDSNNSNNSNNSDNSNNTNNSNNSSDGNNDANTNNNNSNDNNVKNAANNSANNDNDNTSNNNVNNNSKNNKDENITSNTNDTTYNIPIMHERYNCKQVYQLLYVHSKITILTICAIISTCVNYGLSKHMRPSLTGSIDVTINSFCLLLSFTVNDKYYRSLCYVCRIHCCHCCCSLCFYCSRLLSFSPKSLWTSLSSRLSTKPSNFSSLSSVSPSSPSNSQSVSSLQSLSAHVLFQEYIKNEKNTTSKKSSSNVNTTTESTLTR